jgi:hypothetical protein
MLLGDRIHAALSAVGLTPESVSGFIGRKCACKERIERINAVDRWARRVLSGKVENAVEYLKSIVGEG